jgi:hypothetical protein
MSKLSKKISLAGRAETAQFGFTAVATGAKAAGLLCGVRLGDAGKTADAASKGADFVLLEGVTASKLKGLDKVEASVGLAGDFDASALGSLAEAGVDFVVLSGLSALAAPLTDESLGRVLVLSGDIEDTPLRLLGDLGLDALIVSAPEGPLTVEQLLAVRRVSALTRTPLLAATNPDVDVRTLELLRDSGVGGVIVDDAGKLAAVKERIAALPARGKRKGDHTDALLPAQGGGGHNHDDEDWDDD